MELRRQVEQLQAQVEELRGEVAAITATLQELQLQVPRPLAND